MEQQFSIILEQIGEKMIPKVIHQIWVGKIKPTLEQAQKIEETRKKVTSEGFEYQFWSNIQYPDSVPENIELFARACRECTNESINYGAFEADALRYLIIFRHGGIYIDCDYNITRSLHELFNIFNGLPVFARRWPYRKDWPTNAFLAAPPGHPLYRHIVCSLKPPSNGKPYYIGPAWLGARISEYCGEALAQNDNKALTEKGVLQMLDEGEFLLKHRSNPDGFFEHGFWYTWKRMGGDNPSRKSVDELSIEYKEAATKVYRRNKASKECGRLESASGVGSSLSAASTAVRCIPTIIHKLNIKTISDCPCGDLHWMSKIDLLDVSYFGFDIVSELISENRSRFPNREFFEFDALKDILPARDLIICRDFLFHLFFEDGIRVLENFRKSGSKYLLTTSFNDLLENCDLPENRLYGYRKINLQIPPYSLGIPQMEFHEFGDRSLNLYFLK